MKFLGCPVCDPYIKELCELPTGTCRGPPQSSAQSLGPNQSRAGAANQPRAGAAHVRQDRSDGRQRILCSKCNQPGHTQENCPTNRRPDMSGNLRFGGGGSGGGGGANICFKCNQPGHYSSNCPTNKVGGNMNSKQQAGGNSGAPVCSTCGKEKTQKTVRKEGPNQGRLFWNCPAACQSEFEWDDARAPNAAPSLASTAFRPSAPSQYQRSCFTCGRPGHDQNQCPDKVRLNQMLKHKQIRL